MPLIAVFVIAVLLGVVLFILGVKLDTAKVFFFIAGVILILFGAYGIFTSFL